MDKKQGKYGSCQKKGSSSDNWKNMHINPEMGEDNCIILKEILMLQPSRALPIQETVNPYNNLFADFMAYVKSQNKDPGIISHTKYVIKSAQKLIDELPVTQEDVFISYSFVISLLDSLAATRSFKHRKTLLKKMYLYYFNDRGYNILNPKRIQLIRLIDLYCIKDIPSNGTALKLHPQLTQFIDYLEKQNEKWIRGARIRVSCFLRWVVETGQVKAKDPLCVNVRELNEAVLYAYQDHLQKRIKQNEIKVQSANNYLQTLRRWFQYLVYVEGVALRDPTRLIRNIKGGKTKKHATFTLEQLEKFFEAIIVHSNDLLTELSYFSMLAGLGLRASEPLNNLKWKDVNLIKGDIYLRRKGSRDQVLPLPGVVWLNLELHYQSRGKPAETEWVWVNKLGKQLSYEQIRKRFHRFAKLAGLESLDIGATHVFRRGILTELCENYDPEKILPLANHASVRCLNPYVRANDAGVKKSFKEKFMPVGGGLFDQY